MKYSRQGLIHFFVASGLLLSSISFNASPIPANKPAYYPAWWFERDVIPRLNPNDAAPVYPGSYSAANDFFIINQGQTKYLATQAAAELNAHLPGGAGPAVNTLIQSWQQPPAPGIVREDFSSVNNGQLKNLAKLFYDRLIAVGYTNAYPWANSSTPAADFSIANIGQAKNLFSFDLTTDTNADNIPDWSASDIDGDGMPSGWENANGLDPTTNDADNDPDSDGLSNLQESQMGTNPNNADSDGDGISDYYDYSPTLANPNAVSGLVVTVPDYERYQNGEILEQDINYTKIKLKWQHNGANITKFVIEKKVSAGNWTQVAQVAPGVHEWSDQNLLANQNYYYRLTAVNVSGAQQSSSASVTTNHQVPFLKAVSMRASSLTRLKSEWSIKEFPSDPPPAVPKYYLIKEDTSSYNDQEVTASNIKNTNGTYYYQQTITPATHSRTYLENYSYTLQNSNPNAYAQHISQISEYHWLDQLRGKANLASHTEGSYVEDDSLTEQNQTRSRNIAGNYLLEGTYAPNSGTARWMGNDFDLANGTIIYSGNSSLETTGSFVFGYRMSSTSTVSPNGQWSGTLAKTYGNSYLEQPISTDTTAIDTPAWPNPNLNIGASGGWWQGTPQVTPTQQTYSYQTSTADYQYSSGGTHVLSQEYITTAFMTDTINDLPDWPEEFTYNYYGWGGYPWGWWGWYSYQNYGSPMDGWWLAQRHLSPSEEEFTISKMQYKFRSSPTTTYTLKWNDIFVPEDDPNTAVNESEIPQAVQTHTWSAPQVGGESPIYEIDPSQLQNGEGNYYIAFAPQWRGYNDIGTLLDPGEKTSSGLTFHKSNALYETTFWLSTSQVVHSKYTFSWEGAGITLWIGADGDEANWTEIQNGQILTKEELNQLGSTFHLRVDPTQMSAAFATVTVSATDNAGTSLGEDSIVAKFLPELMVDGNRDGEMSFQDEAIHNADLTGEWGCYRFWCNEDDDGTGDGVDTIPPNTVDSSSGAMRSKRDLEDFTRLWLYFGGLQAGITDGTLKVGLKWKNVTGNPSIKVYHAVEANGGTQYLSDDNTAAQQIGPNYKWVKATVSGSTAVLLPPDVFADFNAQNPTAYLLFEGVNEGKGQLCVTLHKADGTEIGEGPGVWLDIKNIKKMYQRCDGSGKNQWSSVAFEKDPLEQENAIVFVHGWQMSPEVATNYAETFYKRLWQRGFKGRFAAFRWDTHWSNQYGWVPYAGEAIDAYLAQYNDSEHNAWLAGSSLASFINNQLPNNYSKNVAAHSMGNIVAGAALLAGANIQNYALMQAAVPAACYDDSASIKQTAQYDHHAGLFSFTMWDNLTPDEDPDPAVKALAYRGRLKDVSSNLINFYLPQDQATSFAWEINNDQTKPENGFGPSLVGPFHYYRYNFNGIKLYKYYKVVNLEFVDHYLNDPYEAMPYACRTWGKVAGAFGATQGSIDGSINLSDPAYDLPGEQSGFGDEHSAEFNSRIQQLKPFYNAVITSLEVGPANP